MSGLVDKVKHQWQRRKYAPNIAVHLSPNLVKAGSKRCGWTFEASSDLQGATIVSCGLGEDVSFDVEFATRYSAKVILVDPTPRAIGHFEAVKKRLGQPSACPYAGEGKQPPAAYDLSSIKQDSLVLEPSALWIENTKLDFFAPPNADHVSHSIVNFQNGYVRDTPHIEVSALTPTLLFEKYNLQSVPLMKLDIEGAETKVIPHMLSHSIRARQLLVEFDEISVPSETSKKAIEDTDAQLRAAGYDCLFFDGHTNFLYVQQPGVA